MRYVPDWGARYQTPPAETAIGIAAVASVTGRQPFGEAQRLSLPAWIFPMDSSDSERLTSAAMRWLDSIDGADGITTAGLSPAGPGQVGELMNVWIDRQPTVTTHPELGMIASDFGVLRTASEAERRSIAFAMSGDLLLHATTTQDSLPPVYGELTELLCGIADLLDFAFITEATAWGVDAETPLDVLRPSARRLVNDFRDGENRHWLPDAFLWQIVTAEHLARANDASRLRVTHLGRRHARADGSRPAGVDGWAGPPHRSWGPSDAVLDQACADFGSVIRRVQAGTVMAPASPPRRARPPSAGRRRGWS